MASEEGKRATVAATVAVDDTGPDVELFETWVQKHYGESSRTKTITGEKYLRICQLIRGEDSNTNAKFRFWVRSKGFRLISHDKTTDEVTDDPSGSLYVSLHAKEDNTPIGERSIEKFLRTNLPAISFFRKVAMVEEFYDIIKCAHVDDKGVHAGQKKTYRVVSDTYAFLPREVITFYLLNCNTCKPRIQKYGPIHSKVRLNSVVAQKIEPDADPGKESEEPDAYKRDGTAGNQVIRPSPKRYMPTYMDEAFAEDYRKVYEAQLKARSMADVSTALVHERRNFVRTEESIYHTQTTETKTSEQLSYRAAWAARAGEHDYRNFISHATSDPGNRTGLKTPTPPSPTSGQFSTRLSDSQKNLSPLMTSVERSNYREVECRERKDSEGEAKELVYQRKNVSSLSEFVTCSGSCCSHLNSTLDYFDKTKGRPDRFYGYRMEPYTLFQRPENIRNYQERILEARHDKDKLFNPHNIPYFAENKDRYINLYRGTKGWGKMDFPSSSPLWRKTFMSADITDSNWKDLTKRTAESAPLEYPYKSPYQQPSI